MNRLAHLAFWLLAALGSAALAHAADSTLFGPKQYVRTTGAPNQFSDAFTVPVSVGAPFVIRIANGDARGRYRVSSATVTLNGVVVARPSDFGEGESNRDDNNDCNDDRPQKARQQDCGNGGGTIERTVRLGPKNTLEVRLAGSPGGFITITVRGRLIPSVPTSLAPNPLSITAGAAGTLVATLSPPPAAAGSLVLSSSNKAVATLPASVAFALGQARVSIPVSAVAPGTTTVTASANGGSASATVNVTPAPPTISSLAPQALSLTQGASGTLTVTLSAAQTADTQVALASADSTVASVAASVSVPAGQISAPLAVSALSPGNTDVTASLNGSSAVSHINVTPAPPKVVSLLPAVATVTLGAGTTLTLTLSSAQPTDTAVALAVSPPGIVTVASPVIVPAGQTTAAVPVSAQAFGQAGITASLNRSSASAAVNVVPQPVAVVSIKPDTFTMSVGATSQFTVSINATQPTNTEIALSTDQPSLLQVPASVTVAQGQTSAIFTATGLATGNAVITAAANNTSKSAAVHVSPQPAAIVSLLPNPLPLQQGAIGSLTVTINVAQEADLSVALANTAPAIANVPASVTLPAGTVSVAIPVTALAPGSTGVTATVNATSATSTVSVTPPPPVVTSLAPATLSLPKGTPGVLRVTVSRAPNAASAVTLSSTDPSIASVPPEVNIAAGALFAEFPVAANAVGTVTISASLNGGSASSSVTIAPAELATLTLSPQTPTNYVGETVPFTASGTMTDGTTQDFTARVTWASSRPNIATIGTTGLASLVAPGTTTISASFTFTAVQTAQSVTVSASTDLTAKQLAALVLTAPTTTPFVGDNVTVAVSSSDPAPQGGLLVNLSGGGTGSATFPAAVIIPANGATASFVLTAAAAGSYTLTANAQNRFPGTITFDIRPRLAINTVAPASAAIGAVVTLIGEGFDPLAANNQIKFRGVNNTTVASPALTASATQITVRVPPLAESGPITLSNTKGTTQSPPFTVLRDQDFQLVASPAVLTVYQGASNGVQVQLASTGIKPFTGLVSLSAQGLPSGVTPSFSPAATLSSAQAVIANFGAAAAAAPGSYSVVLRGDFVESGALLTRSAAVTINVLNSTAVTGLKGRFVTPAGVGVAGVIVRADTGSSPQPQTTTDAAGNFTLVGLPAGQLTFRFDATPANPLYPIWPYTTTVVANQVTVMPDWTINPPPTDDKFVPIANAATEQVITDPRFPGLEIRLPAGASIVGYDGVPKSRIAVEKVDLNKLPVTTPPIPVGSTYQLYFGTPMGGIPSQRIPVTLPNDVGGEPGDVINVWYFDGSPMGGTGDWKIAGQAVVSADGKTVKMPNGQGIPRFCGVCGLTCLERQQSAAPDKAPNNRKCSGNPVDLSNGQEMPATGGLSCSGLTPINTGMSYNPVDAFNSIAGVAGSLGIGWTLDYDIVFLPFSGTQKRLVMPGNNRVNFADDGSGVYRSVDDPRFDGAEIRALSGLGNEWELKFRDGRAWRFKSFSTALARGAAPTFVTEIADAQGNVLPIDRRPDGRINSVGSGERGVTMSYGSNGFVAQISDTAGRTMSYSYTASNRLSTVTDADGRVTSYTYVDDSEFAVPGFCGAFASSGERLKTITYPGRPTPTANFYGPGRRVLRQTGYDGREFRFAYKVTGACVTHVSTPGVKCTANCPQVDSWENFEAGWRIYGGAVIATTVTQPNGQTTSAEFNSRGSATAEFDPSGQKTDSKLDARNRVTVRTDALGRASKYVYDAKGNITQTTDPLGRITNVTYHAVWNKPTSITRFDEANQPQTWSFTYDAAKGTLLTATNPLNQTATFAYTARGQIERVTDALNHSTSFEHNAAGDLTKTIDALLNETHFSTDGVGRRIATTDPLSNITRNTYNGGNRVTSVTDAKSQQTNFDYDPAGRLAAVTNARHSTVESYTYDTGDRVTTRSDAKAKQTLYQYDSSTGRLSGVTDRKGQVTTYAYDEQNRVVAVTRADGITRFSYDAAGRLAEVADPRGTISYVYDPVDRMVRETQAVGGVTSVIEYGYDALDRRSSRTLVGVIGEVTTYGYDAANKLISIAYRGQITTLEYDAAGRLAKRVLPNDIRQEFAYDDADRLLSIAYSNPDGTLVEQITYGYDGAGRRVNETKSTHPLPDTTFTAMYDEADRMATIAFTATGQSFTLSYDDNGNLIEKRDAATPSYVTTYGWDSRNRLTSIVGPGLLASFEYDALGRRISRTVNGVTTRYLYDGVQALGEIVNGEQTALLTTPNVDEIIARYTAQGVRVFLIDALNTVLAQTKDDRSAQNYYAYSPYGEATALGSDDGNAVQYTARENDQTGLYYNRARYYDPLLKRFISEDPIGLNGGMNVYAYAGGNPISGFDPFGLYCTSAGGMTTCVFPGGPEFKVPTPDGFPASLGPGPRQLSHRYDVQRGIGCADSNDVMQGLIDNPTPGNPSPATPGGTANNARVFGQDNPVTSYLTQDLRTGAPLVVNITGPGSLFPHGYVARTVTDGIAHTYGEGLNWKQSPAQTFQWVQDLGNNYVWGQQMDDIIGNAGGSKCSCRGW